MDQIRVVMVIDLFSWRLFDVGVQKWKLRMKFFAGHCIFEAIGLGDVTSGGLKDQREGKTQCRFHSRAAALMFRNENKQGGVREGDDYLSNKEDEVILVLGSQCLR